MQKPIRRARRTAPDVSLPGAALLLAGGVALAVGGVGLLVAVGGMPPSWIARPLLEPLLDPGLPIAWTGNVLFPQPRAAAGNNNLVWITAALAAGAVAVWALGSAVLLRSRGERLQGEYRLHRAVGASAAQLRRTAAREGWAALGAALLVGIPLGWWGASLAAAAWPGRMAEPGASVIPVGIPLVVVLSLIPLLAAGRAARRALAPGRLDVIPPPGLGPLLPVAQFAVAVALLHTGGQLAARVEAPPAPGDARATSVRGDLSFRTRAGDDDRASLLARAMEGLEGVPGVAAVSLASRGTASGMGVEDVVVTQCGACSMAGLPTPFKPVLVTHHAVSPDTFTILGLGVEEGRGITHEDRRNGEAVAVVSRSVARDHFDREGPLGRQIRIGRAPGHWVRVVGIVEDRLPRGPDVSPEPHQAIYLATLQFPPERLEVELQTEPGRPAPAAAPALDAWVAQWSSNPGVALGGFAPPDPRGTPAERALRWFAALGRFLGWMALAGAALGLGAVLAHRVRERMPELALRRAVGAPRARVMAEVLGDGLRMVAGGAVAGCWLVLLVSGLLGQWLEGLALVEPGLLGGILAVLTASGLGGALLPAWTAAHQSPARGLTRE